MSELLRESNITELKASLNDKLEREVVAFLNYREGGDIYIGVNDDGTPAELNDVDGIMLQIGDRAHQRVLLVLQGTLPDA